MAIVFYIARVNKGPRLGSTGCPFNEHLNAMCARDKTLSRPAPGIAPSLHHHCNFIATSSQGTEHTGMKDMMSLPGSARGPMSQRCGMRTPLEV